MTPIYTFDLRKTAVILWAEWCIGNTRSKIMVGIGFGRDPQSQMHALMERVATEMECDVWLKEEDPRLSLFPCIQNGAARLSRPGETTGCPTPGFPT